MGIDTLSVEDIAFVVEALDDDRSGNVEVYPGPVLAPKLADLHRVNFRACQLPSVSTSESRACQLQNSRSARGEDIVFVVEALDDDRSGNVEVSPHLYYYCLLFAGALFTIFVTIYYWFQVSG